MHTIDRYRSFACFDSNIHIRCAATVKPPRYPMHHNKRSGSMSSRQNGHASVRPVRTMPRNVSFEIQCPHVNRTPRTMGSIVVKFTGPSFGAFPSFEAGLGTSTSAIALTQFGRGSAGKCTSPSLAFQSGRGRPPRRRRGRSWFPVRGRPCLCACATSRRTRLSWRICSATTACTSMNLSNRSPYVSFAR